MITTTEELALFGGPKTVKRELNRYNPIGREETSAAAAVVEGGILSQFVGCWEPDFFGGPKVQAFERQCEAYFGVKHAVSVNSWTSGLVAAIGAIGIEPGDEVIVTPWTMAATATAVLQWNAIPVFADIEPETFCLDPASVEANISPYTKAIVAVDIFGHPSGVDALRDSATRHGLKVITDTAQAPGSRYKGRTTGVLGDIGGFSLNRHKHIHTGEGGILVTDDDKLADRLRLIRNHAEAVVGDKGETDLRNMIGHNFRLGEIEAAIGIEQLKKLDWLVDDRRRAADRLSAGLCGLPGLRTPVVKADCTHSYYMYPMVLNLDTLGVTRARIFKALEAEGVPGLAEGYVCLHLLPMYQQKIAYGSKGFPWTSEVCHREVSYEPGICPVAETLHKSTYLGLETCMYELTNDDVDLIVAAFHKTWNRLASLA